MTALLSRLLHVARALFEVHVDTARREISRDLARVVSSVFIHLFAFTFTLVTLLLADVGAILLLHDVALLEWWSSLLTVVSANAALAVLFALVGWTRIKRPLLTETRALARKTKETLRGA